MRVLTAANWEAIRALRLEALQEEPQHYASDAADWAAMGAQDWQGKLAGVEVFGAEVGGQVIGLAALFRKEGRKMAHRASVGWVYVAAGFRRAGHAAAMMAAVEQRARELGVSQLELAVAASNAGALRFYKGIGFDEFGRLPNGIFHEGTSVTDVLMVKPLR